MATATAIRAKIVEIVEAAGIVPAGHVYDSRAIPLEAADLPCVIVQSVRTEPDRDSTTSQHYLVRHRLGVQYVASANDDATLALVLDDAEVTILSAILGRDSWIDGLYESVSWVGTERATSWEGEALRGAVSVQIEIIAREEIAALPTVAFRKAHVEVDHDRDKQAEVTAVWEVVL